MPPIIFGQIPQQHLHLEAEPPNAAVVCWIIVCLCLCMSISVLAHCGSVFGHTHRNNFHNTSLARYLQIPELKFLKLPANHCLYLKSNHIVETSVAFILIEVETQTSHLA